MSTSYTRRSTDKTIWDCALCDETYVVPTLARDCEARHRKEQEEQDGKRA